MSATHPPETKKRRVDRRDDMNHMNHMNHAVGKIFLQHGGLEYLSNDDLFPVIPLVSRGFRDVAARVLTQRCETSHPSLHQVIAENGGGGGLVTWNRYRCFESHSGAQPQGRMDMDDPWSAAELQDTDFLIELTIKKKIVWHAVLPMADLTPHRTSVISQRTRERGTFFEHFLRVPYWEYETADGVRLFHVNVVWRKRDTGKMTNLLNGIRTQSVPARSPLNFELTFSYSGHVRCNLKLRLHHEPVDGDASLVRYSNRNTHLNPQFAEGTNVLFSVYGSTLDRDCHYGLRMHAARRQWA